LHGAGACRLRISHRFDWIQREIKLQLETKQSGKFEGEILRARLIKNAGMQIPEICRESIQDTRFLAFWSKREMTVWENMKSGNEKGSDIQNQGPVSRKPFVKI